mgnify:CR=1 FL=1|jgi:hypothetical protein
MERKELNQWLERLRKAINPENKIGLMLLEILEMLTDRREEDDLLVMQRIEEYLTEP